MKILKRIDGGVLGLTSCSSCPYSENRSGPVCKKVPGRIIKLNENQYYTDLLPRWCPLEDSTKQGL